MKLAVFFEPSELTERDWTSIWDRLVRFSLLVLLKSSTCGVWVPLSLYPKKKKKSNNESILVVYKCQFQNQGMVCLLRCLLHCHCWCIIKILSTFVPVRGDKLQAHFIMLIIWCIIWYSLIFDLNQVAFFFFFN